MTPDNPLSADASCLEKAIGAYVDARERGEDPGPEEFVIPYPKCTVELRAFIDDYRRTHDLFASFRAEATQDYSPPTASPSGPEKAVRVALPTDAEPPTAAVEQTLRQRLRAVALLIALGVSLARGVGLVFAYPRLLADPLSAFTQRPCYGNAALVVCLEVLAFVLLSPRRSAGLRRLRLLEWLVFAPPAVAIAWDEILGLAGSAPAFGHDSALMLAYGKSLTWVLFMVGYGVLVPNTWRRCAAVVGLLTLLGLLPDVCVLTWQGVETGPLAVYLVNKVFWFSVAATIVIYGARRLEILGREAAALGHYRLKGRLGAGGMGEVFLAEHVLLRRPCALKLIRPERAGDAKTLQRFEREVRATATLTHPNTVQVFDYAPTEGGTFYYVMEYLPGLTLEELVQRDGPLPPARA